MGAIKCSSILQSLEGRCHGNQFCGQICEIDQSYRLALHWHSEMD